MRIHQVCACFSFVLLAAAPLVVGQERSKSSPRLGAPAPRVVAEGEERYEASRKFQLAAAKQQSQGSRDQSPYEIWFIAFDSAENCRKFQVDGTTIITRFDKYADVFVRSDPKVIDQVRSATGYEWADVEPYAILPPPPRPVTVKETPKQLPEPILRGGYEKYKGKGVIVAVVDTGIDFRHPDFITYGADGKPTSRLLYFWDTGSAEYAHGVGQPAPVKYPTGAAIGTVYDRETLTKDLRGEIPRIPVWDIDGHGTACAGIAAGNGAASAGKHTGVAPLADIIAVRISSNDGYPGNLDNAYLLNAICNWLDEKAADQPLVVSCSFGAMIGGRDGARVDDLQLDARFPLDQPKRAICIAAGNEGDYPIHGEVTVRGGSAAGVLTWMASDKAAMEIYVATNDPNDLRIGPLEGGVMPELAAQYLHPLTKQIVLTLYPAAGAGAIYLQCQSGKLYAADAYLLGGAFTGNCVSFQKMVATPAASGTAITVGSYDWNDQFHEDGELKVVHAVSGEPLRVGALSTYSTPGPRRRDEAAKPEISAPGQWFTAPAAANVYGRRDSSGRYQIFNGTSAATPYTAGVVALMMEKNPSATLGEIKKLLQENASPDPRIGQTPNPKAGYGKLDLKAVAKIFEKL
jgi:subtilisin family serine protease